MWGSGVVGAVATVLGFGGLVGCASDVAEPLPTRAECREDPSTSGCEYGVPAHLGKREHKTGNPEVSWSDSKKPKKRSSNGTLPQYDVSGFCEWPSGDAASMEDCDSKPGTPAPSRLPIPSIPPVGGAGARECWDVTTYDYNWDNDMLCFDVDGSEFHTSYEGAVAFLR